MPENYPDPVTGPFVIPSLGDIADAPEGFKEFADSIPIGGNIRIIDAASTPFTITQAHSGALLSFKVADASIKFDPALTEGFNCGLISTAGAIYVDPAETFQGDSQVSIYTMGSVVKVAGDVIVSRPQDLSEVSANLKVNKYESATVTIDAQNDKNGVLTINTQDNAQWSIVGGYGIGDVVNICNASDTDMTIIATTGEAVKFWYGATTIESDGSPDRFTLAANSTATLVRIPKTGSTSTDFALGAIASAVSWV